MNNTSKSAYRLKSCILAGVVSLLFSYSLVFGTLCKNGTYSLKYFHLIMCLTVLIMCFFAVIYLWKLISYLEQKVNIVQKEKNQKSINTTVLFWITFAILNVMWIPRFIASYPGFFVYDQGPEFVQIFYEEVPVNPVFPMVHSLLMLFCCKVGHHFFDSYNVGIALFTTVHSLVCAFVFSYETTFIYKLTKNRVITIISIAYFSLTPVIVLFSGCTNSTVLGTSLAVLILIKYYELFISYEHKGKARYIIELVLFALISVLACNTRRSFAALLAILIVVQLFIKTRRVARTIFLLAVLISTFIFNHAIERTLNADKNQSTEMMGVPVQQLAYLYVNKGEEAFEEDEKKAIMDYYAEEHFQWFCPENVDPIKMGLSKKRFEDEPKTFYKLWAKKGFQYPLVYLEAWNYLTYEAWYPFSVPNGYVNRNYVETDNKTDYFSVSLELPAYHENYLPKLFEAIKWFSTQAKVYNIPIFGWLSTIGFQYFILVFLLGYDIISNKNQFMFFKVIQFFYFIVMLFAPLVVVRYHLLLFFMYPVTIGSLFFKVKSEK